MVCRRLFCAQGFLGAISFNSRAYAKILVAVCYSMIFASMFFASIAFGQTPATAPTKPSAGASNAANPPATAPTPVSQPPVSKHDDDDHLALMHLIESLEPYHAKGSIKGSMVVSGSTTMQSMARAWLDRFIKFHPDVSYTKGQEGTDAAIKEISENPQGIAGAGRPLTEQDLNNLKSSKCKEPMAVIVALDPLALYVHKENPLASVTPEQLESIFRAAGSGKPHALKWRDLGLTGEWADQPIRIHGRSDVSGTTGFIKQWILGGGELAKAAQIHETNIAVTQGVGKDKFGVALCGFGDHNADVRAVPLVLQGIAVEASEENFLAGRYPFVRPLMLIVDQSTLRSDGGLRESILRYVLSRDGQLEAIRAGFFPLDPAFIRKQLDLISGPQVR